ncbi:FAD-binding oxidoreductase [Agrobacterium rhizogenes]|uniref:Oxidoreductase n=1 Tax=Rhizobium rhizogenes NBRC 13257 TaxID=1220581 RepID=A0AA87PYI0_RHIRH|nr:FAD-binding oxidoreductase [Rhizobium rhizogenes]OCI93492.1 amino acid dehydrogenase [Agrobacterium sp. 13-626]OCJ18820.1 amino acid dehydrogenase [Agrobacterium sp. B131/95]NTF57372.1 FAD-binding oxidoreductase [Rhizobium rhizogenes]NTF76954.1 FAD-binding oxidoreductase [Rhizobium rhizogenes]NTF95671.1 FAD-binding oxidoreductase [Rhizobium rhizogenes]
MPNTAPKHIAVIGCGIVGACSALALLKDGHRVTIIEPGEPGDRQAASYGNGAFLSPASIIPMSVPGLWKKVPAYLLDPEGPLTIRWKHLLPLTPWLLRFLSAGSTLAKVQRTAKILSSLLSDAPMRHRAIAADCGQADMIRQDGLLYVYPDRASFEADAFAWGLRRDNSVAWRELSGEELHAFEPSLNRRYTFAAFVEAGGHCVDPGAYVSLLVQRALGKGARLVKAGATGFRIKDGRLTAVDTDAGPIECDGAVIAAGIRSKALAKMVGDRIPLESERGYHVEVVDPKAGLRIPIMPSDGKMANTMMPGRLRASGQVELASVDAAPDWRRADILLRQLLSTYPDLGNSSEDLTVLRWQGNRPSTPDGLPVISRSSATADVMHAFGHGHVGLAAGPKTGELVAASFSKWAPTIDIGPFAASRFR